MRSSPQVFRGKNRVLLQLCNKMQNHLAKKLALVYHSIVPYKGEDYAWIFEKCNSCVTKLEAPLQYFSFCSIIIIRSKRTKSPILKYLGGILT